MKSNSKIFVAGGKGMVGSAIIRALESEGFMNIVSPNSTDLDLRNQDATFKFFVDTKPDYVFVAAAKVGGIHANNKYRAQFLYDNLVIQSNIIHSAYLSSVKKLLFLGSSCIYPKMAPQPLKEDYLLSGPLEYTNEPYAIAKIAGIKLCEAYKSQYGCDFISAMPTNLYGPGDNYHPENSHVLPALLRKFHEARKSNLEEVVVWGTGTPKREFLHVDDLAKACIFLMREYSDSFVNVGTGEDISIYDLAIMISEIVGFTGKIVFDSTKPDGTPRKLLDVSKIKTLGWAPSIKLEDGIRSVYEELKLSGW